MHQCPPKGRIRRFPEHREPQGFFGLGWPLGLLVLFVLAGYWTVAAWLYPSLPARIPVHFNLSGAPDRFAHTSFWTWFLLPMMATGLTALMVGVSRMTTWLARKHPAWINVPRKAQFLALPEPRRVRALRPLGPFVLGLVLIVDVLFLYITYAAYRVAVGAAPGLGVAAVIVALAVILVWVLFGIFLLWSAVVREIERSPS